MNSSFYKYTEFFILFILVPISFVFNYSVWVKIAIGGMGFLYVIYLLLKFGNHSFSLSEHLNWKRFWRQTLLKLGGIALITIIFVYITNKTLLFSVLINKPLLWIFILFIYSFLSVYPQELIYRTLYFQRYDCLFKNKYSLIFVNALLFSLAHIFFKNSLVLLLTFIGGLLFAWTYFKTKSTLLVSIEHAVYGCWLFTVGMGGMLGFPLG